MKLYTKTGDAGTTSLSYGGRVPKDDMRIDAYGTLDELNAQLGLLLSLGISAPDAEMLRQMQCLVIEGSAVLARPCDEQKLQTEHILTDYVATLEQRIDTLMSQLPEQHTFLLPGGCRRAAETHVARVTCRRAERRLVAATSHTFGSAALQQLLNRMSDYLYMLARRLNAVEGMTENTMP